MLYFAVGRLDLGTVAHDLDPVAIGVELISERRTLDQGKRAVEGENEREGHEGERG
jgi:hypothetical protein